MSSERSRAVRGTTSPPASRRRGPDLPRRTLLGRLDQLTRWRLAAVLLAVTTAFFALRARREPAPPEPGAGVGAGGAAAASRAATLRQLRIPGHLVGLDEHAILRDLERAGSVQQIAVLCERLGFVGTDRALDLLGRLARDRRAGFAEAAIAAVGHIGTDAATSLLVGLLGSPTARARHAAVGALGRTGQPRAADRLRELAQTRGHDLRVTAIQALGEVGGDEVIDLFRRMPDPTRAVEYAMVQAAATMGGAEAEAFLLELADGGHAAETRAAALAALPATGDEARQAMLMEILAAGDPARAAAAAQVLGRSRAEIAVPVLLDVARAGGDQASHTAMAALGEIGSPAAVRALGEIMATAPQTLVAPAAHALAQVGTPEARAALMQAARSPRGDRSATLSALIQLGGDDVGQLMLEVARQGPLSDRQTALQHLVDVGHPEAEGLVVHLATTGPRGQRQAFQYLLTRVDEDAAREALWSAARGSSGYNRQHALDLLAQTDPGDPELTATLIDRMQNGRTDELGATAATLARAGTPEGREALLASLSSGDPMRVTATIHAVGQMLGDPDVASALAQAARSADPQVRTAALGQLVQNGMPEGVKLAEEMLASGREQASQAMQILVGNPTPEAQRLVRSAASQQDPQLRAMAASALAASADPEAAAQSLIQLSRDSDQEVRSAALGGLAQVGSEESIGILIDTARAGDTANRRAALQALAYTDDNRSGAVIAEAIAAGDPELAATAISVSHMGGRDVEQALVAALQSGHEQVRMSAAQQLRARGTRLAADAQRQVDALTGGQTP